MFTENYCNTAVVLDTVHGRICKHIDAKLTLAEMAEDAEGINISVFLCIPAVT